LNFDGVGFNDVIDFLRDVSGANIFVDWKSLEAAGVDKNSPVTARMKNVRFDKAIDTILASAGGEGRLIYKADRGVISITAGAAPALAAAGAPGGAVAAGAAGSSSRHAYNVQELTGGRGEREQAVVKMITGSVAPSSWKANGGSGEAKFDGGKLVVTTTPENQKAVANLLEQVRRLVASSDRSARDEKPAP
jgi:hypothetical protein